MHTQAYVSRPDHLYQVTLDADPSSLTGGVLTVSGSKEFKEGAEEGTEKGAASKGRRSTRAGMSFFHTVTLPAVSNVLYAHLNLENNSAVCVYCIYCIYFALLYAQLEQNLCMLHCGCELRVLHFGQKQRELST